MQLHVMSNTSQSYSIVVRGILDQSWNERFEPMKISYSDSHNTHLQGVLPDQPALFGIIAKIQRMGLELLEIRQDTTNNR